GIAEKEHRIFGGRDVERRSKTKLIDAIIHAVDYFPIVEFFDRGDRSPAGFDGISQFLVALVVIGRVRTFKVRVRLNREREPVVLVPKFSARQGEQHEGCVIDVKSPSFKPEAPKNQSRKQITEADTKRRE